MMKSGAKSQSHHTFSSNESAELKSFRIMLWHLTTIYSVLVMSFNSFSHLSLELPITYGIFGFKAFLRKIVGQKVKSPLADCAFVDHASLDRRQHVAVNLSRTDS